MSHDICPDTGEPCTCDGSEPCTCGCGGCGHTAEEEAAAAAYREAHREGPSGDALDHERKIIVVRQHLRCDGMRAAVCCRRRARAHYAFARLHYRRLRPVLGHAVLGRCARRLPRRHRGPHNPCRLPSARPLTTNTTTKVPNVVVWNMWTKQLRNTRFARWALKNASTCIVIKTKHLLVGLCETLLQQCDIIHTR